MRTLKQEIDYLTCYPLNNCKTYIVDLFDEPLFLETSSSIRDVTFYTAYLCYYNFSKTVLEELKKTFDFSVVEINFRGIIKSCPIFTTTDLRSLRVKCLAFLDEAAKLIQQHYI